jgi:flavin reductase (DIM6/NTAB) family NADH-FMN oxidoreductase RutF
MHSRHHGLLRMLTRRTVSTVSTLDTAKRDFLNLLREIAQPVAVVTALMPRSDHQSEAVLPSPHTRFHGATLSSFSSIALDPHPLVAFSLRVPSRMATALKEAHAQSSNRAGGGGAEAHMVLNLLSAGQADVAMRFARADIYTRPFEETHYRLSEHGLPVLEGVLGALSCALIAPPWPLHDLNALRDGQQTCDVSTWSGAGPASELCIAQVVSVEKAIFPRTDDASRMPLIYHRRAYATATEESTPAFAKDEPSPVASFPPLQALLNLLKGS